MSATATAAPSRSRRREPPALAELLRTPGVEAAAYERESRVEATRDGFGMIAQDKDTAKFAARYEWHLPPERIWRDGVDENASGKDWDLPGLNAMLDAAKAGAFRVLLVPRVDRFARDDVKAAVLEDTLKKYGVRVCFLDLPPDGQDTAHGKFMKHALVGFAAFERELIRLRTMRGRREKAEHGVYVGGAPAPYGYRKVYGTLPGRRDARKVVPIGLRIEEAEAEVVRRIFALAHTGPVDEIARALTADGIPTPLETSPRGERVPGKGWSVSTVAGILYHPVYRGEWLYGRAKGDRRNRDGAAQAIPVPPIISAETWEAAHAGLATRRWRPGAHRDGASDPFEWRGRLVCGHCGAHLQTLYSSGVPYYMCPNHPGRHYLASRLDDRCPFGYLPATPMHRIVWYAVMAALTPEAIAGGIERERARYATGNRHAAERRASTAAQLTAAKKRLEAAVLDRLDAPRGSTTRDILDTKVRELERQHARLERELDAMDVPAEGISESEADYLTRALSQLADGADELAEGPPEGRRRVYELLRLGGRFWMERDGVPMGKHGWRFELNGIISVRDRERKEWLLQMT